MMMTAEQAIAESAAHDKVVRLEWDVFLEWDLLMECEDHGANGGVTEYWGTTDDGNEWRVHLTRESEAAS